MEFEGTGNTNSWNESFNSGILTLFFYKSAGGRCFQWALKATNSMCMTCPAPNNRQTQLQNGCGPYVLRPQGQTFPSAEQRVGVNTRRTFTRCADTGLKRRITNVCIIQLHVDLFSNMFDIRVNLDVCMKLHHGEGGSLWSWQTATEEKRGKFWLKPREEKKGVKMSQIDRPHLPTCTSFPSVKFLSRAALPF